MEIWTQVNVGSKGKLTVSGSCGEKSTGCSWGSDNRSVFPSALCALCVWTSTTALLPTRTPLWRRPKWDPLSPRVPPLCLKQRLKLNLLGNMLEEWEWRKMPHQPLFPPLPREGGQRSKNSPWFIWFLPFCLNRDQNFGHIYTQQKNI